MLLRMQAELIYFALSVLCGLAASVIGSGISLLHRKRKQAVWLGMLDLIYWFGIGFFFFIVCFVKNDGVFRGYAAVGTLIGCGIEFCLKKAIAKLRQKG